MNSHVDDFQDDGGAPGYRERMANQRVRAAIESSDWGGLTLSERTQFVLWGVVRFFWLFPLVGTAAIFISLLLWLCAIAFVGEDGMQGYWWAVPCMAFAISWEKIVEKSGGFGSGPLWFSGMMNSPSKGMWGLVATGFRSLFVWLYLGYSLLFWMVVGIALWAWQSGAWAQAVALKSSAGLG